MEKSNKSSIAKAAAILTIVSAVTLIISFLKESVIAYYFGTSSVADAYTVAVDLPITIFSALSMAVSTVLIPNYTDRLVKEGKKTAEYYACNLTTVVLIASIILLMLGECFSGQIVNVSAPGLNFDTMTLAVRLFRIVLPATLLALLVKINTGICNSHKEFLAPALAPNFLSFSIIIGLIIFSSKYGIYAATYATIFGAVVELVYSCIVRRKYVHYRPFIDIKDKTLKKSIRMAIPVFLGISAAELNKIVDKVVSSLFETGSIASLNYAAKLSSGISNLLITAIATVIFPEMATSVAGGDEESAAKTYVFSINIYILLLVPMIVGGTFLSQEIIKIIYGRGLFDNAAVKNTAPIFACYLACLLFSAFRQSSSRFFYSYGNTKLPMINTLIGVALNIAFDLIFAKIFGVPGLALATTISTAIISFILMVQIKKKNAYVKYKDVCACGLKSFVASIAMFIAIWSIKFVASNINYMDSFLWTLVFAFVEVVTGVVVYTVMLLVLKVDEVNMVTTAIKKVIRGKK